MICRTASAARPLAWQTTPLAVPTACQIQSQAALEKGRRRFCAPPPPPWRPGCPDPAGLLPTARAGPPLERPDAPARLLIVWHSRTGMAEQMALALRRGAEDAARELEQADDIFVDLRRAAAAQVDDLVC